MGGGAMISATDMERFARIRERVFDGIRQALEEDGHCKSYEGGMSIGFPNYFERERPEYAIHLSCYVLGPSRGYDWSGSSLSECMDSMEAELDTWWPWNGCGRGE